MAWRRAGDKPLSEPMMISLRRIHASLGLSELIHSKQLCLWYHLYPNRRWLGFLMKQIVWRMHLVTIWSWETEYKVAPYSQYLVQRMVATVASASFYPDKDFETKNKAEKHHYLCKPNRCSLEKYQIPSYGKGMSQFLFVIWNFSVARYEQFCMVYLWEFRFCLRFLHTICVGVYSDRGQTNYQQNSA